MNVSRTCQDLGISTSTFYRYATRFQNEGVKGLFTRSRRPHTSPTTLTEGLEEVIVRLHKELTEDGWDASGPSLLIVLNTRRDELWPTGQPLPSATTINRKLKARGLTSPVPQRRPKRATRRFQRDHVNELWQYDGFQVRLAERTTAVVLHLTDDCSRVDLALQAVTSENTHDVWQTFTLAVGRYGLPAEVLTDNGIAFSGRRRGWQGVFERNLTDLNVRPITSSIGHPETNGKNERAHQRVRKWMARRPPANDLTSLQRLLDEYREAFNNRPNRVLDSMTPHQRHQLGPVRTAQESELRTRVSNHVVSEDGKVYIDNYAIGVGRGHRDQPATVFVAGDHYLIFVNDTLVTDLIVDTSRKYQPQTR